MSYGVPCEGYMGIGGPGEGWLHAADRTRRISYRQ